MNWSKQVRQRTKKVCCHTCWDQFMTCRRKQESRSKSRTTLGLCPKDRQATRQTPTTSKTQDDNDVHTKGTTQDEQRYTRHERQNETHWTNAKLYLVAHITRHKTWNMHQLLWSFHIFNLWQKTWENCQKHKPRTSNSFFASSSAIPTTSNLTIFRFSGCTFHQQYFVFVDVKYEFVSAKTAIATTCRKHVQTSKYDISNQKLPSY